MDVVEGADAGVGAGAGAGAVVLGFAKEIVGAAAVAEDELVPAPGCAGALKPPNRDKREGAAGAGTCAGFSSALPWVGAAGGAQENTGFAVCAVEEFNVTSVGLAGAGLAFCAVGPKILAVALLEPDPRAELPKKLGIPVGAVVVVALDAAVGTCAGLAKENVVEGAEELAAAFGASVGALVGFEGNSMDEALGASEDGMVRAGRLFVEAFVLALAFVFVDGVPNAKGDALGASVEAAGLLPAEAAAAGGAANMVAAGATGTVVFSGDGAASCFTFSLSFAIAAASRSCFSHFEYDRTERSIFGVSGVGALCNVDIRRKDVVGAGWNGLTRRLPLDVSACRTPLRGAASFKAVEDQSKFLPFVGVSYKNYQRAFSKTLHNRRTGSEAVDGSTGLVLRVGDCCQASSCLSFAA